MWGLESERSSALKCDRGRLIVVVRFIPYTNRMKQNHRRLKRPNLDSVMAMNRAWMWVYFYLLIGGILSAAYFIGVVTHTNLLPFVLSPRGVTNAAYSVHLVVGVIEDSMLRVLAWAPDFLRSVILGAQTTIHWLFGRAAYAARRAIGTTMPASTDKTQNLKKDMLDQLPRQGRKVTAKIGLSAEKIQNFHGSDLVDLCDAAESSIESGGGFGWVTVPERDAMQRYWKGVLLVPERTLIVGRLDGIIVGGVQLVRQPRNNEAQFFSGQLTGCFVAPWARRHGLGTAMVKVLEEVAWHEGCQTINLDVRATQLDAIQLYENLGYFCWGHHPAYARVEGDILPGRFYYKSLTPPEKT